MSERIAVLGAGSWGTALAQLLASKGLEVVLWGRDAHQMETMRRDRRNPRYVKDFPLSPALQFTSDISFATRESTAVVLVTPAQALRQVVENFRDDLSSNATIICCSKGIETESLLGMDEVLREVLPSSFHDRLAHLSGPSFADEVLRQMPTAVTVASRNTHVARAVQELFFTETFRTYSSEDVTGVELGGALKNVIAIAAGLCDGLALGANARASLITRGLGEIAKLGIQRGANPITFLGLAGMGDLILTCTSERSRNWRVGYQLARGQTLEEILHAMGQVAEGVSTARAIPRLAAAEEVEMFICERVGDVLDGRAAPMEILQQMMRRSLKPEFPWLKSS